MATQGLNNQGSWFQQNAPPNTGTAFDQYPAINGPNSIIGADGQLNWAYDPRNPDRTSANVTGGAAPPTSSAPVAGTAPGPGTPTSPGSPGGGSTLPSDPQQAFLAAAAALGIPPNQTRGRSTEIVAYLTAHGQPGWQAGGTQADDWVKTPQGQGIDYSAAGSNAFQWNNDDTGSGGNMGSLGGMNQGGPFNGLSLAEFQGSPGFQFAADQGEQAIQRSAFARGTGLTGGTLKALAGYRIGLANQDYGNAFQRAYQQNQGNFNNQFSLANLGATTARNG